MAKYTAQPYVFDADKYRQEHRRLISGVGVKVSDIYAKTAKKIAKIGLSTGFDSDTEEFKWSDYPVQQKQAEKAVNGMLKDLVTTIEQSQVAGWDASNLKNDEMVKAILPTTDLPEDIVSSFMPRNNEALKAFQERKVAGMNLSQRIWSFKEQSEREFEMALDVALGTGKSAAELSRDIRLSLKEPNNLFRRVRNKHGKLVPSKAMQAHKAGRGVYHSSYKNALRVAATETNMAYRHSDNTRWRGMGFVLGIEVQTSINNHEPHPDMCDELSGVYPVDFEFVGWHPFCRCWAAPKLADRKEMDEYLDALQDGEDVRDYAFTGRVDDVPQGFKDWVEANKTRIENSANKPYFIRDNYVDGDLSKGLKDFTKVVKNTFKPISSLTLSDARDYADKYFDGNTPSNVKSAKDAKEIERLINEDLAGITRSVDKYAPRYATQVDEIEDAYKRYQSERDPFKKKQFLRDLQEKCANAAKIELEKWDAVGDLDFVGCTPNFTEGNDALYTIKGKQVAVKQAHYDLVTFKDKFGQTYSYPIGVTESDIKATISLKDAAASVEKQIPPCMLKDNKGFVIINGDHPLDVYFRAKYTGFTRGAMYSSDPIVVHTHFTKDNFGLLANHEIGHHVYYKKNLEKPFEKAVAADKKHNKKSVYPTEYAKQATTEDFAESVYTTLESFWDENWMRRRLPNRYRFVRENIDGLDDYLFEREVGRAKTMDELNEARKHLVGDYNQTRRDLWAKKRAEIRTATRTESEKQAILDRYAKFKEERAKFEKFKSTAGATIKANAGQLAWFDAQQLAELDKLAYNKTAYRAKAKEMAQQIAAIRKDIKELETLIPDVGTQWSKQFSSEELHGVFDAVKKKIAQIESAPLNTYKWTDHLEQEAAKYKFEIYDYLGGNMGGVQQKYKTWKVSKSAYAKQLEVVEEKIWHKQATAKVADLDALFASHSNSAKLKGFIDEAKAALAAGDKGAFAAKSQEAEAWSDNLDKLTAQRKAREARKKGAAAGQSAQTGTLGQLDDTSFFDAAQRLYNKRNTTYDYWENLSEEAEEVWDNIHTELKSKNPNRAKINELLAKVGEDLETPYSQSRKDAAVWITGDPFDSYKELSPQTAKVWKAAPQSERTAIYQYTYEYHNINEPLRGLTYIGSPSKAARGITNIGEITNLLEKTNLEHDMWFQRGDGMISLKKFGLIDFSTASDKEIKALVGKEGVEGAFWSSGSAKGKGFSGDVIFNIYAPKGTKGMYVEPFSQYGNGSCSDKWAGDLTQTSVGYENEFLFQRGTKFKITKAEKNAGTWFIDIEVVEQNVLPFPYVGGYPFL